MLFSTKLAVIITCGIIASGISLQVLGQMPPALNIPPTNAFDHIYSQNGSVTAQNFSMPLNFKCKSGCTITSSNKTHTIILSQNSGFGTGTYNVTQANNVNINSGGYKINFINGTGCTVNVLNSKSSSQVNVTIACTGSGGTITGSGVSPDLAYWNGVSTITNALNLLWDSTNKILNPNVDLGSNLGNNSTRFNHINARNINGTTVLANSIKCSTGTFSTGCPIVFSGHNFNIGSGNIQTGSYKINETSLIAIPGAIMISPQFSGAGGGNIAVSPAGSDLTSNFEVYRKSDTMTNYELLNIGSDFAGVGEYDITVNAGGTGSDRPLYIGMQGNKIIGINTNNTVSLLKNTILGANGLLTNGHKSTLPSTSGTLLQANATITTLNSAKPANPTGTASTIGVMSGTGGTCKITPTTTGKVFVIMSGTGTTNTGNDGYGVDLRISSVAGQAAPANGAALSGTVIGQQVTGKSVSSTGTSTITTPFELSGIATGLTTGSSYWIDIGEYAITGGTASLTSLTCSAIEIP